MSEVVDRVLDLLRTTTTTARTYFSQDLTGEGLLEGKDIWKLWNLHLDNKLKTQTPGAPVCRPPYGLYFIWHELQKGDEVPVELPVYVGLGWLPVRVLQHFGPAQFVDQVLAVGLGGFHRHLSELDESKQNRIKAGLERLRLGFVFYDTDRREAIRRQVVKDEEEFIHALRPVTNDTIYDRKHLEFQLEKLIAKWSPGAWSAAAKPGESLSATIDRVKQRHGEVIACRR